MIKKHAGELPAYKSNHLWVGIAVNYISDVSLRAPLCPPCLRVEKKRRSQHGDTGGTEGHGEFIFDDHTRLFLPPMAEPPFQYCPIAGIALTNSSSLQCYRIIFSRIPPLAHSPNTVLTVVVLQSGKPGQSNSYEGKAPILW